ncbi:MAG TPA: copper resistance protein B [Chromatiaceae bacterium]|nr:copper resistance protein B [Chromatiaceae bacterium]HIN83107.1 copper resistance protein B [Chromatiales bacterium]HIO55096.1 copper resistance protein B [Chromatiales bacterium]
MIRRLLITLVSSSLGLPVFAGGMDDDPLIGKVMIGQFETRSTDGSNPLVLEAHGWLGKDLQKLWIKTDIERADGDNEEVEVQALYSRAIAPYWDFQVGWRHDSRPEPDRDWAVIGFQGVAPYWFEIDAAVFIGESGQTAVRLEAEYEALFTQQLILTPEVKMNVFGKDDAATGIGSGLSDIELGVRLRYEIKREFAPYIGVNWTKLYGDTADFARAEGEDVDDVQFVVGVRAWF